MRRRGARRAAPPQRFEAGPANNNNERGQHPAVQTRRRSRSAAISIIPGVVTAALLTGMYKLSGQQDAVIVEEPPPAERSGRRAPTGQDRKTDPEICGIWQTKSPACAKNPGKFQCYPIRSTTYDPLGTGEIDGKRFGPRVLFKPDNIPITPCMWCTAGPCPAMSFQTSTCVYIHRI
jgi:hypothetical protein